MGRALEGLTQVSYQRAAPCGEKPLAVRYALGSVRTFCEKLCWPGEAEEDFGCGAEAEEVLAELRNRADATILLRASTRDDAREKQELLRGMSGPTDTTPPDELLRPSETASEPTRMSEKPEKPRLWARIFKSK